MEFKQVSETTYIDMTGLKVRRENKTRKIFGKIIYHSAFDNSHVVEMAAFKKQGGEYRLLPYKLAPQNFCDFFNTPSFKPYFDELTETTDFPYPLPCPFGNVSRFSLILTFS